MKIFLQTLLKTTWNDFKIPKKLLSAQAKMTSGTWPENDTHVDETKSQVFMYPENFLL